MAIEMGTRNAFRIFSFLGLRRNGPRLICCQTGEWALSYDGWEFFGKRELRRQRIVAF